MSFDWRPETSTAKTNGGSKHDFGLIAQEVYEILPEIVNTLKFHDPINGGEPNLEETLKEVKGIDYTKIIPFLIAAIQDLKQELDEYKSTHP